MEWQKHQISNSKSKNNFLIGTYDSTERKLSSVKKTGIGNVIVLAASIALLLLARLQPEVEGLFLTKTFIKILALFSIAPSLMIFQNKNMRRFAQQRFSNCKIVNISIKRINKNKVHRQNFLSNVLVMELEFKNRLNKFIIILVCHQNGKNINLFYWNHTCVILFVC